MGQSFRELIAWQKAMQLVTKVYRMAEGFPKHEIYGLTSQIRRAAIPIPSNIAEGQARHSQKEFLRFLSMARGSLAEVQTQTLVAEQLGYIAADTAAALVQDASEVCMVLNRLYAAIDARMKN